MFRPAKVLATWKRMWVSPTDFFEEVVGVMVEGPEEGYWKTLLRVWRRLYC